MTTIGEARDRIPTTPSMSAALNNLAIAHRMELGAISIAGRNVFVRASHREKEGGGVEVSFESFLAMEPEQLLTQVSSNLSEDADAEPTPIEAACRDWIQACLAPILRLVDYDVEADTVLNLYVESRIQKLFLVYSGPHLVQGENCEQWSQRFPHSLIDWLIGEQAVSVPDRRFNLIRLGAQLSEEGSITGMCQMNGKSWPEADAVMSKIKWPGKGAQQIQNFVVLRRLLVPQAV